MSGGGHELGRLQRWMQAVIMHPAGVEAGVASAEARRQMEVDPGEVERVVTRSAALDGMERLAIYGRAYYARLLECLREEYPVVLEGVGREAFDAFAFGYLQAHPSQSYTLNRLGENFARYLEETRPGKVESRESRVESRKEVASGELRVESGGRVESRELRVESQKETLESRRSTLAWAEFVIDLARLEWAIGEVFDGPGNEGQPPLGVEQIRAVPAERWAGAKLVPVESLRLLVLRYPVHEYFTAVRRRKGPVAIEEYCRPVEIFLAITRRDYVVRRYDLSRPQYELLGALVAREPVGRAIEGCAAAASGGVELLVEELREWFYRWAAEGFFQAVEIGA